MKSNGASGLKLFIGLPTYGGQRWNTMALLSAQQNQRFFKTMHAMELDGSLLANGFNKMLITARQLHAQGECDFFLLLHADIVPIDSKNWLDQLMEARQDARLQYKDNEPNKAQVLSVVSPIKDARGITSTAVEGPTVWNPRRLTMKEVLDGPETFTREDLLVNTGMLLIDMRKNEWVNKVCFNISDGILRTPDGNLHAGTQPEDWQFSRAVKEVCRESGGIKLWATRKVKIIHRGYYNYPNFTSWGADEDPGDG